MGNSHNTTGPARDNTEVEMSLKYVEDAIAGLNLVNQYGKATIDQATLDDLETQRLALREQMKFRDN